MAEVESGSGSDILHGARVLIVDDMAEQVAYIARLLELQNCVVYSAHSGEEALAVFEEHEIDAAIVDIVMPGMTGTELCTHLLERSSDAYFPVIMMTGMTDEDAPVRALAAGAVDLIVKPIRPPFLLARLRSSLEHRKLHAEIVRYKERLQEQNEHLEERILDRTHELETTRQVTAFSLARLSESRDTETGAHLERIRLYVRILSETLARHADFSDIIDDAYHDLIFFSSPLHDIGKVGIPDEILLKPGKLSREEFEIMKWHTVIGGETLEEADREAGGDSYLKMACEIAIAHHEKWSGAGYPKGLQGDDIPLSARIVALGDVYDALSSKRPYKEAMDHEKTKGIILEGKGDHFDPRVVDAFLEAEDRFLEVRNAHVDLDDGVPRLQRIMDDLSRMRSEGNAS